MYDLADPNVDPSDVYKLFREWHKVYAPNEEITYDLVVQYFQSYPDNWPVLTDVINIDTIGIVVDLWINDGLLVELNDGSYCDMECWKVLYN